MRRQVPSIRNPRYPLAYRIYLSLPRPSHPWKASDLPYMPANEIFTSLLHHGFIISRGKKPGKGGTQANVWVFNPPVLEILKFLNARQSCTHLAKTDSLFGDVYCRRLKQKMSLYGCKECLKCREADVNQPIFRQLKLQLWGV